MFGGCAKSKRVCSRRGGDDDQFFAGMGMGYLTVDGEYESGEHGLYVVDGGGNGNCWLLKTTSMM